MYVNWDYDIIQEFPNNPIYQMSAKYIYSIYERKQTKRTHRKDILTSETERQLSESEFLYRFNHNHSKMESFAGIVVILILSYLFPYSSLVLQAWHDPC